MTPNYDNNETKYKPIDLTAVCIAVAVWLVLSGWILSLLSQLNAVGYWISATVLGLVVVYWHRLHLWRVSVVEHWRIRRFRRLLPRLWLLIAILIFLGGILYAPSNYDGLTYRIPRVLNWLWEGKWHWIDTSNTRMNFQGVTWEWLAAPFIAVWHTDRPLFLINFIPYLLLPSIIFRTLRLLGTGPRKAWLAMWVFPAAYGVVLQAGSIGNDMLGMSFVMAAMLYALCWTRHGKFKDLFWSSSAMALATGIKATNLPLLLPWVVIICFGWRHLAAIRARLFFLFPTLLVSFLPTAFLNWHYCGDCLGTVLMPNAVRSAKNPLVGIVGNGILLILQNMMPPVLPYGAKLGAIIPSILPLQLFEQLRTNFEMHYDLGLGEIPIEENSGLGLGLVLFMAVVLIFFFRHYKKMEWKGWRWQGILLAAGAIALGTYMAKSGMTVAARLCLPYYPVLGLVVYAIVSSDLPFRVVRPAIIFAQGCALFVVVMTPARPLWPALSTLRFLRQQLPENRMVERMWKVYQVYRLRPRVFEPVLASVPASVENLILVGYGDDVDTSLWHPFGARRVIDWNWDLYAREAGTKQLKAYVLMPETILKSRAGGMKNFINDYKVKLVGEYMLELKAARPPELWYVFKSFY